MVYFVCENAREKETADKLPMNEVTEENMNEKYLFKNNLGFKKFKNINISTKLHYFVFYRPRIANNHNTLLKCVCGHP